MDVLWLAAGYSIGMAIGQIIGKSSAKNPDETLTYALHFVKDENDALKKIRDAYSKMNVPTPDFVGFDKDGDLVQRIQATSWEGKPKISEEINNYIKLLKFMNRNALQVKVYENTKNEKSYYEGMEIHKYFSQLD